MNRSILAASLCATLLFAAAPSSAAVPPTPASTAATPPQSARPVVQRPRADPQTERVLTAMNNASTWGHPDLFGEFAGMRLYSEGHYKAAMKYFKYGARYADKLSQLSIGLMYENGRGVGADPTSFGDGAMDPGAGLSPATRPCPRRCCRLPGNWRRCHRLR